MSKINLAIPNELKELLDSPFYFSAASTPPLGIRQFIEVYTYVFQSALSWMVNKRWDNNYKVRGDRDLKKSNEALGGFLNEILNLCEYCDSPIRANGLAPYSNALEWFKAIVKDFYENGLQRIMLNIYSLDLLEKRKNQPAKKQGVKKQLVRQMQEICSVTSEMTYPDIKSELAFVLLLHSAIHRAERVTDFKNGLFKTFIKKWREAIDMTEEYWVSGYLSSDGEKLYARIGKGGHTRNLTKEYQVCLMRN